MKHSRQIIHTILAITIFSLVSFKAVFAWGPERDTFTMENPATYPTFNSITDNPTIGDERNFVRIGEINADVTELSNEITIVPGRQYLVYIYFHNNASATFNDKDHEYSGVAVRTRMSSSFSTVVTPTERGTVTATITADNSNPESVWDEAYMSTTTDKVLLHYVSGSAKIYSDWKANGSVLSTNLFTQEGTLIGLNALNGVIPGCEEYHGIVTYVLKAEELGGSIDKTVSKDGVKYYQSAKLTAGDEVYFRIAIHNTGDVALTNATVKDYLPEGMTLVPGSVEYSANSSTIREPLTDSLIYNFGTLGTGNTIYVFYRAKVGENFDCEGSELLNVAELVYDSNTARGDSKEDTVILTVKKADCAEPYTPVTPEIINPPKPTPDEPTEEPDLPQEIVNTGPLEIILAVIIVLSICFGGFYLYRTNKALRLVKKEVSGVQPKENPEEQLDQPKDTQK